MGLWRDFDVESPWVDARGNDRLGASTWVFGEVQDFVAVLKCQWLLYDLSEDLPHVLALDNPENFGEGLFGTLLC